MDYMDDVAKREQQERLDAARNLLPAGKDFDAPRTEQRVDPLVRGAGMCCETFVLFVPLQLPP